MAERQILLVTGSRNVRRYATRSLASAGYRPEHLEWDRGAILERLAAPLDMCIIDADGDPGDDLQWLLERLYQSCPEVIALIIARNSCSPRIRDVLEKHNLNNLIAKHGGVTTGEIIDEVELIVTCEKLFRGDIFGIGKYLGTWAVKVHERIVRNPAEKAEALHALRDFLDEIDCFGAIKPAVLLVADELLMNAMYNAPRDESGAPKYATLDRQHGLELAAGEQITFQYACDGRNIAVSIRDLFGSLDRQMIVKYLERCFNDEKGVMEEKQAGAGLGLYMVFNSITQLTFNIHLGVATEAIALFYARGGAKALRTSGRSLNIFLLR